MGAAGRVGTDSVDVTAPAAQRHARRPPIAWTRLAVLLAGAWALPVLTHLAHADWILPPLVLLGVAGLLPGALRLLDRLVLAVALLIGVGCAMMPIWSVWPFGLHPVPIGGLGLTALVGYATVTGRRPTLPRPSGAEAVAVGAAIGVTAVAAWPYLRGGDLADRLSYLMVGEDNSRHFAQFQAIRRVGGVLYLHSDRAADLVAPSQIRYPQGWHSLAATLDGFLRSGPQLGSGESALTHYLGWSMASFGLFVLAVIWAAGWVAGRLLDGPRRFVVTAGVVAICAGSELMRIVVYGYPAELLGLTAVALLVGLTARPVPQPRLQIVLMASLLVTVGFTYYLFLPPAAVIAALWLVRYRRTILRQQRTLVVAALAAVVVAHLPMVVGVLFSNQAHAITEGGNLLPAATGFVVLGGLVVAGLASRAGRRLPTWRGYGLGLATGLAYAALIAAASLVRGEAPKYYFGKTLHLLLVILAIGIGAVALWLPPPWRRRRTSGRRTALAWATALVLAVAALAASGLLLPVGGGVFPEAFGGRTTNWTRAWLGDVLRRPAQAEATAAAYRSYPPAPGTTTLVVDSTGQASYLDSVFLSALQNESGRTAAAIYGFPRTEPARTRSVVDSVQGPIRFVVVDRAAFPWLQQLLAERPELRSRVTVVAVPGVSPPVPAPN